MTNEIEHTSFFVTRELAASPRHAFQFWSDPELKARWSGCHPDWTVLDDTFEFRAGGGEAKRWRTPDGKEQTFNAHYLDIVPEQRIIYAYEMGFDAVRLSASLVTITFEPSGAGTTMTFTEQVAILAGGRDARNQRLAGTEDGLDRLIAIAEGEAAASA